MIIVTLLGIHNISLSLLIKLFIY